MVPRFGGVAPSVAMCRDQAAWGLLRGWIERHEALHAGGSDVDQFFAYYNITLQEGRVFFESLKSGVLTGQTFGRLEKQEGGLQFFLESVKSKE